MGAKKINAEVEEQIINLLYEGNNITQISKIINISPATINRYRLEVPLFDERVSRARTLGLEIIADQIEAIPDTYDDVNKARLKVDTMKWILAHRDPTKWGERIDLNINNTVDIRGALDEARNRIRNVLDIAPSLIAGDSSAISHSEIGSQPTSQAGDTAENAAEFKKELAKLLE
jgi:hypothetical protein